MTAKAQLTVVAGSDMVPRPVPRLVPLPSAPTAVPVPQVAQVSAPPAPPAVAQAPASAPTSTPPAPPAPGQASAYKPVDWAVYGDTRNARHFATMFRGQMLYMYGHGAWLRWSGDRWVLCDQGQEIEAAKETAHAMMVEASTFRAVDPDRGKQYVKDAMATYNLPRLKAALELAQSEPGMSTGPEALDADLTLLGVGNGVVDLKTGMLVPNRPEMLVTRYCDADYGFPTACPRWLQFLAEVFSRDQATINAVQRMLGYTLTGLNTEEIIVFATGFGHNGKSIFGNIINRIMGGYSKVAPDTLLAARRRGDHGPRSDIAMLEGARLVSVNELKLGMELDEQAVKALAGREPISARKLFKEFRAFDPHFTVWVRTNHKPIIKGDDDGIWRRIVVLPFRQKFEGANCDKTLEEKLWAERNGILRWMVDGARLYLATRDLALSPTIEAERQQYRSASDVLGAFLAECTVAEPTSRMLDKDLFARWGVWCSSSGHHAGSKTSFTQRIAERGFPIVRSNGCQYYKGLRPAP